MKEGKKKREKEGKKERENERKAERCMERSEKEKGREASLQED